MDKPKRTAGELWCHRRTALKETHVCIFVGSFRVARRTVKVALGANRRGITQLLAYHISRGPSEDRWITMLESVADTCYPRLIPSGSRRNDGRRLLFVTQSNAEIWTAIDNVFGPGHAIQTCRTERERRVLALTPAGRRKGIKRALTKIWKQDEGLAVRGIEGLAANLRAQSAEASEELTAGLPYLFTISRLGLPSELRRFLGTTALISKFEKNLRAKIRRRAVGRRNLQAAIDALAAVCREDLLGVESFDFDLAPLADALKVARTASELVPARTGRATIPYAQSDQGAVTSLDADVRIRLTSNTGESNERSLAICVSWIKSLTTQMRSLLNVGQAGESGEQPNSVSPHFPPESRVDRKTITWRWDHSLSAIAKGKASAHRGGRNDPDERTEATAKIIQPSLRADSEQSNASSGSPIGLKEQPNSGSVLSLPGREHRGTMSLLPMRSIRSVVRQAGRLAKRISPVMRPMRHFADEGLTDHSNSRDIATLADRLFVIPGLAAPRCVVFSGLDAGVGSTSIASSVARMLASRVSGPVCIVDANCRDPFVHDYFCIDNSSGLVEAVASPESVLHFAQRPSEGNLWVLPTHSDTTSPTGFPSADHMRALVSELVAEFDYVLIDGPPLGTTFDSGLLARMSDGLVLVLEAERTLRERARSIKSDLELAEVRVLAAVLNKCSSLCPDTWCRWFGGNL